MKILHITSELTKKNFSIASLILFISEHLKNKLNYEYSILSSKIEKILFKNENIETISFSGWLSVFIKLRALLHQINRYDVVHIHGIWAPIQIFSILICNFSKKKKCNSSPWNVAW